MHPYIIIAVLKYKRNQMVCGKAGRAGETAQILECYVAAEKFRIASLRMLPGQSCLSRTISTPALDGS
jgi:hypothetical protein